MSVIISGTDGITSPGGDSSAVDVTTPKVKNAGTLALEATGANIITFSTNGTEAARFLSSGVFDIKNTGSAASPSLIFGGDGDTGISKPESNTLVFSTFGAEGFRIDPGRRILQGTSSSFPISNNLAGVKLGGSIEGSEFSRNGIVGLFNRTASDGELLRFTRGGNAVGAISITTSSTSYNTSSDYRLKENLAPITGALARVAQIPVYRFNFIADPDKTVDGFVAHELAPHIPEAVTGEKDEVDEDGNPMYQGVDQSKPVPLLTAAIQELLEEVNTLKARIEQLENQ